MTERDETNAAWREVRERIRGQRNARQPVYEAKLGHLHDLGRVQATRLSAFHWRVVAGEKVVDYWPRSGKWRPIATGAPTKHGWPQLLEYLGVREAPAPAPRESRSS